MTTMKLQLIEWVDSVGCASRWTTIQDPFPEIALSRCRSVGWIVHENAKAIVIVPHLADMGDSTQGQGDLTIPKCAITRRKTLSP